MVSFCRCDTGSRVEGVRVGCLLVLLLVCWLLVVLSMLGLGVGLGVGVVFILAADVLVVR